MRHPEHHIFQHTPDSLRAWCDAHDMKPFRAQQILEWLYQRGVSDPAQMTNLSAADRATLARDMAFLSGDVLQHQIASDDTQKLLVQWWDGAKPAPDAPAEPDAPLAETNVQEPAHDPGVRSSLPLLQQTPNAPAGSPVALDPRRQTECVMIPSLDPAGPRRTACISSQVGCPVGCRFCASGLGGLDGNLTAGRIVEQVWRLSRLPGIDRISNVVFMGMGEPLANFAAVTHAVRTLAAQWGMGIGARKITISTVGLPQAIERLAREMDLPVTLALSLHAPSDDLRRQLIPWAEYTTIADLLSACGAWYQKTGREVTLEYILLGGVNDRPEHARQLAALARTLRANVNLIRYNEVKGMPYSRPSSDDVREFQRILRTKSVNAHIRRSRGRDIAAACGQLRHEAASA
ncbi:MAG: 23S rRNA (adenine(2503)-C(2))-methyltransferase RlmN [Phycisphaerales bacterium]|jgi:23S rRNA (adenine2503-C2)-methyltransferase|nr:23S rRNA (adenine(2503)-C(2))-methyltransferase RlmN [Phycisphaerales bacterium]